MRWFEHPENEARGWKLKAPYDKIVVGCDPLDGMTKETADSFDVYVNVSCSECNTFQPSRTGQHMHWYPVNEMGLWNLSYLFWIKKVLDHHFEAGHRIYLHCHAGAYRSPSAALLWLQSRGHSPKEALSICNERGDGIYRIWKAHDNIPAMKDQMFELMRKHPTWSLGGILGSRESRDPWNKEIISGYARRMTLMHKYFWFYYKPRSWFRNKRDYLCYWLKGCGWETKGPFTEIYPRKYFWSWGLNAEREDDDYYRYQEIMWRSYDE